VLSYKGLEVSAFFQYEFGRTMFNNQTAFMSENGNRNFNGLASVYEARWQQPGDITSVPRPFNGGAEVRGQNHVLGSTRLFEDASYIRLKQLTVAYNVPTTYARMVRLSNLRVYAQGVNVLTWTKWTGFDPEFVNLGAGNNGVIPPGRTWTMGLQLGF
jgi:TonB-dependent starch-binding outer membrane protein SusC